MSAEPTYLEQPRAEPTDCTVAGCTSALLRERHEDEPALCAWHRIVYLIAQYEEACHQAACAEHRPLGLAQQVLRIRDDAISAGAHVRELEGARHRGHKLAARHRAEATIRRVRAEEASGRPDPARW